MTRAPNRRDRTAANEIEEPLTDDLRYDGPIDPEGGDSRATCARLVPEGSIVLELGCSTGRTSEILVARGCRVTGLDHSATAAGRAAGRAHEVAVADLDGADLQSILPGRRFDVVLAADVLEHLRDPARVLRSARDVLASGGRLVVSLPNVAHASVRYGLLSGRFEYGEIGLLDRTHLHHYTWPEVVRLLDEAGWRIRQRDLVRVPVRQGLFGVTWDEALVDDRVRRAVEADPEHDVFQFIVVAEPVDGMGAAPATPVLPGDGLAQAQARELIRLDTELRTVRGELDTVLRSRVWRWRNRLRAALGRG